MPIETVNVAINGPNAQAKTLSVPVDIVTGNGSTTFQYAGASAGLDNITATISNLSLTSNTAAVSWIGQAGPKTSSSQSWNGAYWEGAYGAEPQVFFRTIGGYGSTTPLNSFVAKGFGGFNVPSNAAITGVTIAFDGLLQYSDSPGFDLGTYLKATQLFYQGAAIGSPKNVSFKINQDAKNYNFYFGGPSDTFGASLTPTIVNDPSFGYGISFLLDGVRLFIAGPLTTAPVIGSPSAPVNGVVAVPTGAGSPGFQMIVYWAITPSAPAASGTLQVTPANTGPIALGTTAALTVSVNNYKFNTLPYIPILEGTGGHVYIYNNPSSPEFDFQTYAGQAVDKPSAASNIFQFSTTSNSAWQGVISTIYDSGAGQFEISYGGGALPTHVDSTSFTLQADDIAWFSPTASAPVAEVPHGTNSYDVFTPSLSGGGSFASFEVDYMVKPTVSSVTPTSVPADGATHVFTVSLSKPFSPQQQGLYGTNNTVNATWSFSGGTSPASGTATPVSDAAGWITGYTISTVVTSSTNPGTLTLSMLINGTLTYLSGDSFVANGPVTYINGVVATITTTPGTGTSSVGPTPYSFSNTQILPFEYINGVVYSPSNNIAMVALYYRVLGSTVAVFMSDANIGRTLSIEPITNEGIYTDVPPYQGTVNGQSVWFTPFSNVEDTPDFNGAYQFNLGYTATDSNGLSTTFWDTTVYTDPNNAPVGGGGGGCPAVEMFVSGDLQVKDCAPGAKVSCLVGEPSPYAPVSDVERHEVQWMDWSTETCYRFVAENGAEVVVSASTPVPTRETLIAVEEGFSADELPAYACDIRSGMHVITDVGNGPEWSMLVETICVGPKRVARMYCGGRNFAAGVEPGKYIYTHNIVVAGIVK